MDLRPKLTDEIGLEITYGITMLQYEIKSEAEAHRRIGLTMLEYEIESEAEAHRRHRT